MGAMTSRDPKILTQRQLKEMWRSTFSKLDMTRADVQELYNFFREMAVVSPDSISYEELLITLRTENSHFNRTLYKSFLMSKKSRKSNKVFFKDFVKSIWHFCSLSKEHMPNFLFDMYDSNRTGILEQDQIDAILTDALGKNYKSNPKSKRVMGYLSGKVSKDYFCEVATNHIVVVYFASTIQHQFQDRVMGVPFWQRLEKIRRGKYSGNYTTLCDIFGGGNPMASAVRRGSIALMGAVTGGANKDGKKFGHSAVCPEETDTAKPQPTLDTNSIPQDDDDSYLHKAGQKRAVEEQPKGKARRKSVIETIQDFGKARKNKKQQDPQMVTEGAGGANAPRGRRKSVLETLQEGIQNVRKGNKKQKQPKSVIPKQNFSKGKVRYRQVEVSAKGGLEL